MTFPCRSTDAMEGDGGMVAIVQGLREAGLAVTLMNKTHFHNSQRGNTVPISKSSVETNTAVAGRSQAAQVRDDHYTSSYQVAHCSARPTSPPQRLPEFPPQRIDSTRDHGNFQVGSFASGYDYIPPKPFQAYRGGVWPDRGSFHSGRMSPPSDPSTDPFVHSLRRYPLPIERSPSSELVQRLLTYTQNKYTSKNSNSRSIRSLRDEIPTRDQKTDTTATKHIQTYTRAKHESRDYGANTNNEIKFSFAKKGRSFSSASPYNMSRAKSSHTNDNYDYLKPASSRRYTRHPEVRYLNDVKKCIRDTIKQICDDKPLVCPQIKSRYNQHKREHHGNCPQDSCPNTQCGQAQASTSSAVQLPAFSHCEPPTVCPSSHSHVCGYCRKPAPCSCKSSPKPPELPPETKESVCTCKKPRNKIEHEILNWLKGVPVYADDSSENKCKREEMVKDLADKLKSLEGDRVYEKKAKKEILKCIEKLPMWYPGEKREQETFKNKIADDLFNRLTVSDDFKEMIEYWLDDVEFESGIKVDKGEIVENLVNRLKPIIDDPDEMKSEIKDILQDLPIKNKNKVINKLADQLSNDLNEISKGNKDKKCSWGEQNDYENQIWDWLEDIVDIPEEDKKVHKKLVLNLAMKLQDLKSENADNEVIEEEIMDFLKKLSRKGVSISSENKDILAKKLLNKIKSRPKQSITLSPFKNLNQSIINEISDLVDDIPSNISDSKRNEIKDKVADVLAKNIDNLSRKNDNINREIVSILRNEAKMSEDEATDLASALINRVKGMPLSAQTKLSQSSMSEDDIKQLVSEEVSYILDDYDINTKKKKEVERSIIEVLADQIVRGTDDRKTKNNIFSILQDADISDEDASDITNRLMEKNKELTLSYRSQDSKLGISKSRLNRGRSMSPIEREDFEANAEREILDFIEDLTGDDSLKENKKRKEAAEVLVHRLGEIMSDPDDTDKEKSIIVEVSKCLENMSLDLNISTEEAAKTLADRIQRIGFKASTPKKGSFYPRRVTADVSSIFIDGEDSAQTFKKQQVKSNEETQYEKDLADIIESWMDDLSIDLSTTEDRGFKETMIKDLAGDIVDRQKYLQLNPNAKKSDQEELEHLKYQVFRWLNKLLDVDDLSSIMQRTKTLMNKIKDIEVPELAKPASKFAETEGFIPLCMDTIKDEISMWMDEIPQNLYTSTDKNFQKRMVNELADKIQKLRENDETDNIDREVTNWLSKMIKNTDREELTKMTEDLKARLKRKAIADASSMLSQDSGQFVEENLIGGIQDWLKSLPLYLKRNSAEKREQESLVPELVKGLKSVFETARGTDIDTDKLFINEIVKHLKKFPMDPTQRSDKEFLQRFAAQLLHYLKSLQMFQNISERKEGPPDEYLKANMDNWIGYLPLIRMDSKEAINFENLKQELTSKVKQIRQDPTNEQKLKDEIRNYLMKFPLEDNMKRDQKFINDKVEELLNNLSVVPIESDQRHVSDSFVKNAVSKWMKLLPLEKGKTTNDIPINAVNALVKTLADLLVKTDMIEVGDIKKTLEDATAKFLKSVPLDSSAHCNAKSLAEALFKDVKEMSRKTSVLSTGSTSVMMPPPIKKAADILFDNIGKWCDNLPLKGNTPEEIEKAKKIKQEVASKLIHKIGELNMNPEVFNDDFLYDEMLEDEIDSLLTDFSSEDIRNNLPAIKNDLMGKVKEARQKTREETAGKAYKQQLREAISKTLPPQSLDEDEKASFEVLKDNLADAFITLHYVGDDVNLKNKYKTKINDEITQFCNEYLRKNPASPIDSKKLNQDLYHALKCVPIPKEETVRNEVELVKIKDEVNAWVKELPLKELTPTVQMQTNKMIAVLSKKIHDIEKQKELSPDANYDDIMKKEITKLVKKLPTNLNDTDIPKLADKLIENLKSTEKSRRVSASTRHSIEPDSFDIAPAEQIPHVCKPTCRGVCRSQYVVPPTTLGFEDREHLQRIRERSPTQRLVYPPSKDASVSPLPVDAGSQTEIRPWETCQPSCRQLTQQNSGIQTQRPPEQKTMQAVGSQAEVSPQVVVKEYYWDTMDPSRLSGPCSPCPTQYPQGLAPPQGVSQPQCQFTPGTCTTKTPGVSQQPSPYSEQGRCSQCPHISPQPSVPGPYATPTPQPRRPRKEWEQPCSRREMPRVSSEDHPEPGTSRSFRTPKARVTRLGSFDEMDPICKSRHDWKFPEEDEFWSYRRFVSEEDEPFFKERKKEEEKTRCRCRERILTKCTGRKRGRGCHSTCPSNENMKNCAKCCGAHCPHPSYLYFRQ